MELPDDFDFHDIGAKPTSGPLAPKETQTLSPGPIDTDSVTAVWKHIGHLYVYGWATYNDKFPHTPQHVTRFCYELTGVSSDPSHPDTKISNRMSLCSRHNCTDEECNQ